MAATSPCKEEQADDTNSELNIRSMNFNPIQALYDPSFKVTSKKPKMVYQNMAAFESAFKKFGIWKLNSKNTKERKSDGVDVLNIDSDDEIKRRFLPHQMPLTKLKYSERHQRNIFSRMPAVEGPQSLLWRCVEEQLYIKVTVRKKRGVRGSVEGKLIAFDKHWNLLLNDVIESWKRRKTKFDENKFCGQFEDCGNRLRKLGIVFPSQRIKSLNRKTVEIQRRIPQLLVRGEQVVVVAVKRNEISS